MHEVGKLPLTKGNALRMLARLDSQPLRLLLVSFAALTQILMIFRLFRAALGPKERA